MLWMGFPVCSNTKALVGKMDEHEGWKIKMLRAC